MQVKDARRYLEEKSKDIAQDQCKGLAQAGDTLQALTLKGAEIAKTTKSLRNCSPYIRICQWRAWAHGQP